MGNFQLDARRRSVLLEVVNDYIQNAEPVGSRSISKKHPEKLSAATIRNAMSDLEELGYLHQPHTSSGRIPTDQGYQFYVNHLLNPQNFLKEVDGQTDDYGTGSHNLQEVLETACEMLSKNSNQTGLVMLPPFSHTLFKQIEFIKVASDKALAVFYSDLGILQNKIIPLENETTQEQLTSISHYLNKEFSGKSIQAIRVELIYRLKNEREHYDQLTKKAVDLSSKLFAEDLEKNPLIVEGALNLLDHPEFRADLEKIKGLLKALEEKSKLVSLLDHCLKHDGMTILIGQEILGEEMEACSLIAQNYQKGDATLGALAIFGPKRMDYKKIISLVNQTAKTVSNLISQKDLEY
ncbi:MAG: heat-inducible transcriptional repressor HrcA [Nitrospinae bacterium]|jgi:heat-inducible transcriptional repressor|nr:heat-inducible transcriptional repressor HrcA [Nitrospinota bacterium]MDA1108709.1 heat-inducible transcriptional repressor HrcA [Nitrospinota bacterium]